MSSWLAIVLPGGGYGPLGAALRLPVLALEGAGAETVVIEYPSQESGRDDRWWSEFHDSVRSQVQAAVSSARPRRVTFVAKSLGTVALATLGADVVDESEVEAIWLTPLFGQPDVRSGAIGHGWRSLLIAGAADNYHMADHHEAVRDALGAFSLVVADANHALEVPGDAFGTVERLQALVEAVSHFVPVVQLAREERALDRPTGEQQALIDPS